MVYEAEIQPEDLPDIPPPDLDIDYEADYEEPRTDLEGFIRDGNYVIYRQ